jgi:hypothetical protein
VTALLSSLKHYFEDHKEEKAKEWVAFTCEPGPEELLTMLFPLCSRVNTGPREGVE